MSKITMTELKERNALLESQYKYAMADLANTKRQYQMKLDEATKVANIETIRKILPIIDDCERGLSYDKDNQGTLLIFNKLKNLLHDMGVKETQIIGDVFDSNKHEAFANVRTTCRENNGKIIECVEKGYEYQGEIVRYPKVVVGTYFYGNI